MSLPIGVADVVTFSPNWVNSIKQRREFKTDIITSRDGTEQRRSLRSKCREYLEYQVLLDGTAAARFDQFIWALQPHVLMMPLWPRQRRLAAAAAATTQQLLLDQPAGSDIRIGDEWILLAGTDYEVVELTAISPDRKTLSVAEPLAAEWPLHSSVYPAWRVQFDGDIRSNRLTDALLRAPLDFRRVVDTRPAAAWDEVADLEINGLEVLLRQLNWNKAVSTEHNWSPEFVDAQTGPFAYETQGDLPQRIYKGTSLAIGRDEVDWYQAFFDRHRGRQVPFLMPSWQSDLVLHAAIGASPFEAPGTELGRYMPVGPIHSHIMVRKHDGSLSFYAIDSIDLDLVNNVTSITTVDAWDEAYGPETCRQICFVNTVRLASDTLSIEWITDELAHIALAVTTVEAAA